MTKTILKVSVFIIGLGLALTSKNFSISSFVVGALSAVAMFTVDECLK